MSTSMVWQRRVAQGLWEDCLPRKLAQEIGDPVIIGCNMHFQSLSSICLLAYFPHSNRYATRALSSFKTIIQPLAKAEMVLLWDIQDFGLFLACQGLMWVHIVYSQHHGKWANLRKMQDRRQCLLCGFYTLYIRSVPVLCFCFSYTTNHVHIEVLISQDKQIMLRQLCSVSELTRLAWRMPFFPWLENLRKYDSTTCVLCPLQTSS